MLGRRWKRRRAVCDFLFLYDVVMNQNLITFMS
jgi:hypothetical protein